MQCIRFLLGFLRKILVSVTNLYKFVCFLDKFLGQIGKFLLEKLLIYICQGIKNYVSVWMFNFLYLIYKSKYLYLLQEMYMMRFRERRFREPDSDSDEEKINKPVMDFERGICYKT